MLGRKGSLLNSGRWVWIHCDDRGRNTCLEKEHLECSNTTFSEHHAVVSSVFMAGKVEVFGLENEGAQILSFVCVCLFNVTSYKGREGGL